MNSNLFHQHKWTISSLDPFHHFLKKYLTFEAIKLNKIQRYQDTDILIIKKLRKLSISSFDSSVLVDKSLYPKYILRFSLTLKVTINNRWIYQQRKHWIIFMQLIKEFLLRMSGTGLFINDVTQKLNGHSSTEKGNIIYEQRLINYSEICIIFILLLDDRHNSLFSSKWTI